MDEIAAWVRKQAEGDLARCRDLIESEAAAPEWSEPSSGVLVTGPPTHDDTWAGTFAIGDSRIVRHVIAHDPRTEIARAESVLAILGLYERQAAKSGYSALEEDRAWALEPVVRLLAFGYRHREGWQETWKP